MSSGQRDKQLAGVGVMASKSNNRPFSILLCLCFMMCCQIVAQAADSSKKDTSGAKECNPTTDVNCIEGADPFRGLKWGIGVAYSSSLGGVGAVTVDPATKVVHVTKQNAGAARGVFEAHYFFKYCADMIGGYFYRPDRYVDAKSPMECQTHDPKPHYGRPISDYGNDVAFGMGPFVSLNTSPFDSASSGTKVFDSVGMGWMIGLNAYDAQPSTPTIVHSLNFGLGAILDTGVKTLAAGVQDGQATTLSNDLVTRQTTRVGFMALLSYRLFELNLK
jgi:hypothetical protein